MNLTRNSATNVLLAEDDDDDYYIFSMAVEEIAFTVLLTRAENGEILLKLLEEKTPDILFLDLLMPCKGGHQCLKEIRANKKYDAIPIIIYSSLADLANVEYCYRQGSNLFAVKPNSISELKNILEQILSIDWKKTLYFPPKKEFVLNPH
ncbi:response regulator [Ohtaekwangia koreensis]|uniref:Response regulator receiver domain-containing protein n=1 Tax=Ohtaekwangia koreensis TaxID=688867 RepID=A0A1T5KGA8_9BACT|nr:response regulator [Ohtaekwangia koreensis]SKC62549.1 Response regulator receiver domain-containing protein [Ohtaekwangia koreensis]